MVDKTKLLYLNSAFTKELPTAGGTIESIYIEGYASTTDMDRSGDVVPQSVWEEGIKNYLKNPIILAQHDYDEPIGRTIEHRIDEKGLWIKARISAAAEVFNLIKDEVLTAFSIGFRILDAEYNAAAEAFLIKKLELVEISVVSVPCNQNTLFNLSKAFDSAEDYNSFKAQFIPKGESAKGLESLTDKKSAIKKEWNMDPKELQTMLDNAAKAAAEQATKALLDKQAADAAEKAAAEKAAADMDARIKAAVAGSTTGVEKLMADIEKRFADQETSSKSAIEGLEATLKEKAAEIAAMQKSKMSFAEDTKCADYADKEAAVILAKITGKAIDQTKFGQSLVQKAGAHVPNATWEQEVSLTMEQDVRRKLVIAPTLRNLNMQTNVMKISVNPEAGYGTWVANADFGNANGNSAGAATTHALTEITLSAFKLATKEYVAFEEEEDALLTLMPVIRDAMVRRTAKSVDVAMLRGTADATIPVKGLSKFAVGGEIVTNPVGTVVTVAKLRALRAALGTLGLTPADVTFVVSSDVYYNLLEDATFMTMDKVGTSATILTGQFGQVGGSPVLVSSEFLPKAIGVAGAVAYYSPNFIVGNQRGLRMDTQDLVETQRKVLVASLRTGMVQISTANGNGAAVLNWVA